MADPDNPGREAARLLNRLRWGDTVVTRAIETLAERSSELSRPQRELLRRISELEEDNA